MCDDEDDQDGMDDYGDDDPMPRTCTVCGAELDPIDGCPNGPHDDDFEE